MGSRRLFVAIAIPEDLKEYILESARENNFPGKITPANNLHITVHFFGSTNEEDIDKIIEITEEVVSFYEPFDMTFKGFKLKKGRSDMIWGIFAESITFKEISLRIKGELKSDDTRVYPHITVSRLKEKAEVNFPETIPEFTFRVENIELWESKLGGKTASYNSIKNFTLK